MPNKNDHIDSFLKEQKKLAGAEGLHWMHWLVVVGSIILTITAWQITKKQVQSKAEAQFERQSEQLIELISERMNKYEDALWAGVATIHSQSHGIDGQEWQRFSDTLQIEKRYPGINGIGVIYHVSSEDRGAFIEEQRLENPDFKIFPSHDQKEHFPIIYIEPMVSNHQAVGLDMAHEKNRYTAAIEARRTGKGQITGPITLVQDQAKTSGFLFFAPYYERGADISTVAAREKAFIGIVYAPFIMKNLMAGVLEKTKRQIGVKITDAGQVIYDEFENHESDFNKHPRYKATISAEEYGRTWVLEVQNKKSFLTTTQSNQPLLILLGGIIVDTLLLTVFLLLTRSNKKALNFAGKMTGNYREELVKVAEKEADLKDAKVFQDLIFGRIPDFIFVKDNQYRIVQANKAFLNNYPENERDKVIGYTTVEKYDEKQREEFLANDKHAFKTGYHDVEEEILFPDGKTKILYTQKIRFQASGQPFILGMSRDITNAKKAEKEILDSNVELERFAYVASHDLQEPLRMVTSFSELLYEEYHEKFDEQGQFYTDQIIGASNRMRALVNDLLEYSRVNQEGVEKEDIKFEESLNEALGNLEEYIKDAEAKVTMDKNLPIVHGTHIRLSRLLQNLIGNAIKYRASGTAPQIHVGFKEKKKEYLFSISDNGIGMKEEYLEQIFVFFKRLHNKDAYTGTGIGLAICKKIVESFGGKIWAESDVGKGSVFYFTVPKTVKEIQGKIQENA